MNCLTSLQAGVFYGPWWSYQLQQSFPCRNLPLLVVEEDLVPRRIIGWLIPKLCSPNLWLGNMVRNNRVSNNARSQSTHYVCR